MSGPAEHVSETLVRAAQVLREGTAGLRFKPPVTHVYNPLTYAWEPHAEYLHRFGNGHKRVIFVGMNPGPFGMVQTGVPFGEVNAVRDWLRIRGVVGKPAVEHPSRPVTGFGCPRCEISGQRLWGLFADVFGEPGRFFAEHIVLNYCPLAFMEESGRNRTPDRLPAGEQERLFKVCDAHLRSAVQALEPEWVVGIGEFALARARQALEETASGVRLAKIAHPSPASPAANRDWRGMAVRQLKASGVWR